MRTSLILTMKKLYVLVYLALILVNVCHCQDNPDMPAAEDAEAEVPPGQEDCNGIFLTYTFIGREKLYPILKNATAQAWSFNATATIANTGKDEIKGWKMFVGFHNKEILVSASNAMLIDGGDFPVDVGNGTTFVGNPTSDLKTAIETAGDMTQISKKIKMKGTHFGVKPPTVPMPKSLKLVNDGFKCPAPDRDGTYMSVCCKKDPKFKAKPTNTTKFSALQKGDLSIMYDVTQTYGSSYLAQVTLENKNPLGRLDHWNLTFEWMYGEFINTMRGAYTRKKDTSGCIYGRAAKYYKELDFGSVMNCEKKPTVCDLPPERKDDEKTGKLPGCCKNGSLLPVVMDPSKSKSIFQMTVYKLPPYDNRTALVPPRNWKISGILNPTYRCSAPIRVAPNEFPDPSGLEATSPAIASWQIVCNITKPKAKQTKCCVSFSAYYNTSVIPCNTCACGCENKEKCNPNARALLMPPEAALIPFENRTEKLKAWADLKHFKLPRPMPCPDNCGVSVNWHIDSDFSDGWTARVTVFNWGDHQFDEWFTAVKMAKAFRGFENVYSLNGTKIPKNEILFFQGLEGSKYLNGIGNGSSKDEPRVPGKQQTVISFKKKDTPNLNIQRDGFPTKLYFNGEECALPKEFPVPGSGRKLSTSFSSAVVFLVAIISLLMI